MTLFKAFLVPFSVVFVYRSSVPRSDFQGSPVRPFFMCFSVRPLLFIALSSVPRSHFQCYPGPPFFHVLSGFSPLFVCLPSWAILGLSWAILRPSWSYPGLIGGCLGPSWGHPGHILVPSWPSLRYDCILLAFVFGLVSQVNIYYLHLGIDRQIDG